MQVQEQIRHAFQYYIEALYFGRYFSLKIKNLSTVFIYSYDIIEGFQFLLKNKKNKKRTSQSCFLINFNNNNSFNKKNFNFNNTEEKSLNLVKTTKKYSHKFFHFKKFRVAKIKLKVPNKYIAY